MSKQSDTTPLSDPPYESPTEAELADWERDGGSVYEIELEKALERIASKNSA